MRDEVWGRGGGGYANTHAHCSPCTCSLLLFDLSCCPLSLPLPLPLSLPLSLSLSLPLSALLRIDNQIEDMLADGSDKEDQYAEKMRR
jgi:hypothetical protein